MLRRCSTYFLFWKFPTVFNVNYFQIQAESTGVQWTPVDSSGLDWTPLDSTKFWEIFGWESPLESTGVHWSPYGIRGGQTRPPAMLKVLIFTVRKISCLSQPF